MGQPPTPTPMGSTPPPPCGCGGWGGGGHDLIHDLMIRDLNSKDCFSPRRNAYFRKDIVKAY